MKQGYQQPSHTPTDDHGGQDGYVLITGGAGFIGSNLARYYASEGRRVLLYDNLSRSGVEENAAWLQRHYPDYVELCEEDVRNAEALAQAVQGATAVFHFAAQVAVTSSMDNPMLDFEVNVRGTLNMLESIRRSDHRPPVVFTSTNKVYGDLHDIGLRRNGTRYIPASTTVRRHGVAETRPLAFCSPYGCSKGAADQYVLDYARQFRIPAVVFRMSCIYGPHQCGCEDQGWIAHFLMRALHDEQITIYSDGMQVRDLLYIDDLLPALDCASRHAERLAGEAFNIGGGVRNTASLLEVLEAITDVQGQRPQVAFADWRPADQLFYVSDIRKFTECTDWRPRVCVEEGIERLYKWLQSNEETGTQAVEEREVAK